MVTIEHAFLIPAEIDKVFKYLYFHQMAQDFVQKMVSLTIQ